MQGLLDWFQAKVLDSYSVSCEKTLIYNSIFPKHKEILDKIVLNLVKDIAKMELPANSVHFDIDACCEDEDRNYIVAPSISILLGGSNDI